MRKRTTITILLLAVLFVGSLFLLTLHATKQPKYHGRSLASWLKTLDDGDREEGLPWEAWVDPVQSNPKRIEAEEAIRAMGTNAIPYLLTALTNRDSDAVTTVNGLLSKQHWLRLAFPSAADYRRPAALAFHALGPAAKPAIPQLAASLNTAPSGKSVALALVATGPEGWAVLTRAITNRNGWGNVCAIWALGSHRATVPGTLPELMSELTNSGGGEAIAGWALGEIGQDSAHVVPALINGLQSSKNDVRFSCARALGTFGTNALSAVPFLEKTLNDTDSQVRIDAADSLKKIAPKAATKAGVK